MKVIKPYAEIIGDIDGGEVLKKIERIGRVCYKSEGRIGEDTAEKLVANLIKRGHEAMLEHYSVSVRFVVDRGVSHEIVRHRVASFAQESTRYCNYGKDDFGNEVTFILPNYLEVGTKPYRIWANSMQVAEDSYFALLGEGLPPEQARAVLPVSLKTEIVMTANLREWRHFFKLRAVGVTGKPHPQMLEVAVPLLDLIKKTIPIVFDDLEMEVK